MYFRPNYTPLRWMSTALLSCICLSLGGCAYISPLAINILTGILAGFTALVIVIVLYALVLLLGPKLGGALILLGAVSILVQQMFAYARVTRRPAGSKVLIYATAFLLVAEVVIVLAAVFNR